MPGRTGTASLLCSPIFLLVFLARRFEIDAEQRRANQRQHDGGPDRAEDIGDRVCNRHRVEQLLGLIGGQTGAIDSVGRKTHRSRDRLRAGIESGGRSDVVAGYLGADIAGRQAEHANHRGKQRLRHSILRDAPHELRPDAIADGEQEHQEEGRLERT